MLTELSALLDLLRAKGVTHYEGPFMADPQSPLQQLVKFDVAPLDAPAKPADKDDAPADVEVCRCGHALYVHTNGLCGDGCDVERCAPPEKAK
jgi:hypothetical protein